MYNQNQINEKKVIDTLTKCGPLTIRELCEFGCDYKNLIYFLKNSKEIQKNTFTSRSTWSLVK